MSSNFYRSTIWRKKREYILKRDEWQCQEHKKYGVNREASIVHHIVPIEEGGDKLKNSNLISVCAKCHNKLHPEKGGRKKY
jgi:5-methylcytosine-specific restriction enzyme A